MDDDNFFSVNRLLEFGMTAAVAQQMVKSMNESANNMQGAGGVINQQIYKPQTYYIFSEGFQSGPYSEFEIARLISENKISKETNIWKPGLSNWTLVQNLPEILRLILISPPKFTGV